MARINELQAELYADSHLMEDGHPALPGAFLAENSTNHAIDMP
jgi:hypothetical protein